MLLLNNFSILYKKGARVAGKLVPRGHQLLAVAAPRRKKLHEGFETSDYFLIALRHSWEPAKPRRKELIKNSNSFMVSRLTTMAAPLIFMIFGTLISLTLFYAVQHVSMSAYEQFESHSTQIGKMTSTFVFRFFKVFLMLARHHDCHERRFGNIGDDGQGVRVRGVR